MPWKTADVEQHKKGLSNKQKTLWVKIANSALRRCLDKIDGKPSETQEKRCAASAIKQASAVAGQIGEQDPPSVCVCPDCGYEVAKERGEPCRSINCPECGEVLVAQVEELSFAVPARIHVEHGKRLDASGLTEMLAYFAAHDTQDTDWHKWGGAAGRKWARRVWGKYEEQITMAQEKTIVVDKPNDVAGTTVTDASEMADYAVDYIPMGPTTFADLQTAQEAQETADKIRTLTYQYHDLVLNAIRQPDKGLVEMLNSLGQEFVTLIEQTLGDAEMEEAAEGSVSIQLAEIEVSEPSAGHVVRLIEAGDVATGGKRPLLLEVIPIQPGWGNTNDNHFYPAEVLERDFADTFDGVKMYETNHVNAETNNRNWVSTYAETKGFDNGSPVGLVGVHHPDFAQRALNLHELEQATGKPFLSKLECSVRGGGKAMPDFEQDGRTGKRVQELSSGLSIDWVSRAGAGGHARRLLESEGRSESEVNMNEKDKEKEALEETELEEVVIEEGEEESQDTPDETPQGTESQETETQETEAEPTTFGEAEVLALIPEHLPQETKDRILAQETVDEFDAKRIIAAEVAYFKALTGSGKPFGSRKPQPVQAATLEETQQQQDAVNARWLGTRTREVQKND